MTLYNILFGVEFWLAVAVWACGAICGVCSTLLALWIGGKHND